MHGLILLWAASSAVAGVDGTGDDPDFSPRQLQRWEAQFRAADANGDRLLDRAEATAALPGAVMSDFDNTDTDGDGRLSPEEMLERQRELRRERERRRRQFGTRP